MSVSDSWVKSRLQVKWVEGFQAQGNAPVQEDYFEVNPERGIFLLADGFGGSAGKQAAETAVKAVRQFLEQEAGDLDATLPFELRPYYSLAGNVLFNAISYANQKLIQQNKGRNWLDSGGASLIAGYLEGRLLAIANVGACSVQLHREGRSKEIVSPKTLGRQVNPFADDLSAAGAQVPLMSFGTARQLEPEITEIEVKEGDRLLFQSSGLSSVLRDQILQLNTPIDLSQIIDSKDESSNSSVIWLSF
jgi:serine/threonine protein phosphatase PrpC